MIILCTSSAMGVVSFTARANAIVCYGYDSLNRLSQVEQADGTAVRYTYDAAGNRLAETVDTLKPLVAIQSPTIAPSYWTSAFIDLAGTASDDIGVAGVTWTNDRGGSGTATGTTDWSVLGVPLQFGSNVITVTAHDAVGKTGSATLTVTFELPPPTDTPTSISTDTPPPTMTRTDAPTTAPTDTPAPMATVTPVASPTDAATFTPTPTATPTPTPTAVPPQVDLRSGVGRPGGVACVPAALVSNGVQVAGTSSDISADPSAFTLSGCTINPLLGTGTAADKQLAPTSLGPDSERVGVFGLNANLIPDGLLYSCAVSIAAGTTMGVHDLGNVPGASDPSGQDIAPVQGAFGHITVTTCTGDCDGNGVVTIGEVIKCVNMFLGQPFCNPTNPALGCPVADANLNGGVSIGEVIQCVNRFLNECR